MDVDEIITLKGTDIDFYTTSPFHGEKIYKDENDEYCVLVYLCKAKTKAGKQCTNKRVYGAEGYCNRHRRGY